MQTAGGRWGILADERTPRPLFGVYSSLDSFPYGLQHTQPEPQSFDKEVRRRGRSSSGQERNEEIAAHGERVGGNHAAQDDGGRKDRSASLHDLSRKFDGHGYSGLPANHARRDQPPRGRVH